MKATYAEIDGKPVMLLKGPKTDSKKKSQRGKVAVLKDGEFDMYVVDGLDYNLPISLLQVVFEDGELLCDESLSTIRTRLHGTF